MSAPATQPAPSLGAPITRERILDAAEALFATRGLAGTAVRDIARAVRLTPASLYNHFAGKQALYEAVLERGVRPLLDLMQGLPTREHTAENMEEMIEAIMSHLARRPHLPRLIQHEAITGGVSLVRLARGWIRPMIEHGIAEMKRDPGSHWEDREFSLLMSAWLYLVFGHFAMAPMLGELFDDDPLSEERLAEQTRFLRKLARLMMSSPTTARGAAPSTAGDDPHEAQ